MLKFICDLSSPDITAHRLYQAGVQRNGGNLTVDLHRVHRFLQDPFSSVVRHGHRAVNHDGRPLSVGTGSGVGSTSYNAYPRTHGRTGAPGHLGPQVGGVPPDLATLRAFYSVAPRVLYRHQQIALDVLGLIRFDAKADSPRVLQALCEKVRAASMLISSCRRRVSFPMNVATYCPRFTMTP